jgi:hypothetical protein
MRQEFAGECADRLSQRIVERLEVVDDEDVHRRMLHPYASLLLHVLNRLSDQARLAVTPPARVPWAPG